MARLISVAYGAVTHGNGGDASTNLTGKYRFTNNRAEASVTWGVILSAATAATFEAAEAALVAELRKDDQRLTITLDGTRHDFNPATNSGLQGRAEITKLDNVVATDRSAEYLCSVTYTIPFDLAGRAGRRDATIQVAQDSSERQIAIFEGTYTAQSGGNDAKAQYDAQVQTWIDAELVKLGGTWNEESVQFQFDDQDKVLTFRTQYEKILLTEGDGVTDVAAVVRQNLRVRNIKFGDRRATKFSDARPLQVVYIDYSASIRSSVTTDVQGLYEGTLRPRMLASVSDTLIVMREDPIFDLANNEITVKIVAKISKSGVLQSRVQVDQSKDPGVVLVPVWDGNPLSRRQYQDTVTETVAVTVSSAYTAGFAYDPTLGLPASVAGGGYIQIFERIETDVGEIGTDLDGKLQVVVQTNLYVFARVDAPAPPAATPAAGGNAAEMNMPEPFVGPPNLFPRTDPDTIDRAFRTDVGPQGPRLGEAGFTPF